MTKRFSFTFIVILFTLSTNFAMAAGAPDPVFWFAVQPDGVNLMIDPEWGWGINSIELVIEVQPTGLNFSTSPLLVPGDWLAAFNVVVGPENTLIYMAAAGIPSIEESSKLFRIDIHNHVGPVSIVFKKAQVNGKPDVESIDLIANGQVENFDFFIGPRIGDVNADGRISVADAYMVLMSITGRKELLPDEWLRADVTNLAGVTAYDAVLILQHAAGIITEFPRYDGKGAPAKNPLSFDEMVEQLRASEEIDDDIIDQLVDARDHEQGRLKKKLLTTWGGIKQ